MVRSLTFLLLLFSLYANGLERRLIIGPEWEFSSVVGRASKVTDRSGGGLVEWRIRDQLVDHVILKAEQYPSEIIQRSIFEPYYFDFPDGFWIRFSTDPRVIEVHASPATIAEFRAKERQIAKYVFDSAREMNFDFAPETEAAHIHFDFHSAFAVEDGFDYLLFRNFIVDFFNHAEIYRGILENDFSNAPGLSSHRRRKLRATLDRFESELGRNEWRQVSSSKLAELIVEINNDVYPSEHYIALSLRHSFEGKYRQNIKKNGSIEIRSVTMRTFDEWLKVAEIFEARLNYLIGKSPIKLLLSERSLSSELGTARFKRYVTESGLDWDKYKSVLSIEYQSDPSCAKFL